MKRSAFVLSTGLFAMMLALAACDRDSGPAEIKYGRDVCELCSMIISQPRHAAELRLAADSKIHKFDDIGDALNWLSVNCKSDAEVKELWIMDSSDGKTWLDARKVYYRRGDTPMHYGFIAVAASTPDSVDFSDMRMHSLRPKYACKDTAALPDAGSAAQHKNH